MKMVDIEVSSFLTKFRMLRDAGLKASLTLSAEEGTTKISLDVELRPKTSMYNPLASTRHRGPAYQRRQERRRQINEDFIRTKNETGHESTPLANEDPSTVEVESAVHLKTKKNTPLEPHQPKLLAEKAEVSSDLTNVTNMKTFQNPSCQAAEMAAVSRSIQTHDSTSLLPTPLSSLSEQEMPLKLCCNHDHDPSWPDPERCCRHRCRKPLMKQKQ